MLSETDPRTLDTQFTCPAIKKTSCPWLITTVIVNHFILLTLYFTLSP